MNLSDFDVCSDQKSFDPRKPQDITEQGTHYAMYRYNSQVAFVARDRDSKRLFLVRESKHRAIFKSLQEAETEIRQELAKGDLAVPPNESIESDMNERAFMKALCRHFVALCGTYHPIDSKGAASGIDAYYCFSAFVCKWGEGWMIVTAGHAIKDFVEKVKAKRISVGDNWILDYFGAGATFKSTIPFNILDHEMFYVDDETSGLDCAIILLWGNDIDLLAKNGIKALGPSNWVVPNGEQVSGYVLLGLPEERTHTVDRGKKIVGLVKPLVIPIRRLEDDTSHEFTRFHAKVDDIDPFSTIVGMSGGPIFACVEKQDETFYYLEAVQSRWSESTHDLYGCPFAPLMRNLVAQSLKDDTREKR